VLVIDQPDLSLSKAELLDPLDLANIDKPVSTLVRGLRERDVPFLILSVEKEPRSNKK
jgi:hypothetical protein